MATLEELREKLDGIDDQIAKLYEERMKVCEDCLLYTSPSPRD